jgi:hypothetical protein
VFSVWSALCDNKTVVFALSVPRLYNTSPLAGKKSFLAEFRGSRVIEQEIATRLHSDLKC